MLIIKALRKHKAVCALLMMEMALTFAIVSHMISLTSQRFIALHTHSGIDEDLLLVARASASAAFATVAPAEYQDARADLQGVPQVRGAAILNTVPFQGDDLWQPQLVFRLHDQDVGMTVKPSVYFGDNHTSDVLRLTVIEGRTFHDTEYQQTTPSQLDSVHAIILGASIRHKLFGDGPAIGRIVTFEGHPMYVVGVMGDVARPTYYGGDATMDAVMLPLIPQTNVYGQVLAIALKPGVDRATAIGVIARRLAQTSADRVEWTVKSYADIRAEYFASDWITYVALATGLLALILVAGSGMAGLSHFWVQGRTAQIATRRALGARQIQILRELQLENLILAIAGVAFGLALSMAMSVVLMRYFGVASPAWRLLAIAACVVMVLGQLAIYGAAKQVASVEPAVAARR